MEENSELINIGGSELYESIRQLVEDSRNKVNASINYAMSFLYWQIGQKINSEIELKSRPETYGKAIVSKLSYNLMQEYGRAFTEKNVRRMMQFAKIFPDEQIVVSLIRQLSYTHILAVLPIQDKLKREFYIELCKHEKWSVRIFRERINSMLYERTAISRLPQDTITNELKLLNADSNLSKDLVFRDPYVLDFLGLADTFSEKDLEERILYELQKFIIEIGSDFAFLSRQKRITIGDEDYYIDLLFFHRRLKCLVAIELKLGKFKAEYKGQMELYLRWLEKYESIEGEEKPIGLILCASKDSEHIELLALDESNIRVAEYVTTLDQLKQLEKKLHIAIEVARNKFEQNEK